VPSWGTRWYAHEVTDVLFWVASSEAPHKVVLFAAPKVQALVDSLRDGDESRESGEWTRAALFVMCQRLLAPWTTIARLAADRQEVPEAERPAVELLLRWVAAAAAGALCVPGEGKDTVSPTWHALAALMSLRLDTVSAQADPAAHAYLGYTAVLEAASAESLLKQAGPVGREAILRNLQTAMQSPHFDEHIFVECKPDLSRAVGCVAGADEGLLRNLANDLLSLF
jgi:hypothetical protein